MLNKRKRRAGFGLTEMIICLVIAAIVGGIGWSATRKQVSKAKLSTISSNLQVLAGDFERAVVDMDFLTDVSNAVTVTNYFSIWDKKYSTCPLDLDNMEIVPAGGSNKFGAAYCGVIIPSINYPDPWGNELRIYYMIPTVGDQYRIIVASAGPNSIFADDAKNGYLNNLFEDDVLLVMEPRPIE